MDCQNVIPYTIEACLTFITMNLSRKVGIIDIKNDAFHEPIPGHQLNILWKMRIQTFTYLTIKDLIFAWAVCCSVSHDDQMCITLRAEAL